MSQKILVFIVASIASIFGLKLVRQSVSVSVPTDTVVEAVTAEGVLARLNELRGSKGALEHDQALTAWASDQLPSGRVDSNSLTANTILERMQAEVEGIAAASTGVFRAPSSGQALYQELETWEELRDSTYTHSAVVIREDPEVKRLTYVWVVLVQRLPKFAPELLADGVQQFYHECARCQRPYNGHFPGGDRILLLQCPHCNENYDILALNTKSRYQRANTYLSHLQLPAALPQEMGKRKEMEAIWKSVLNHCSYENDFDSEGPGRGKDSWQTSAETLERASGDCEDTSILLADWLISRGFEARVVIGETEAFQGHAWCVARAEGEVYLLETTLEGDDDPGEPPLAITMSDRYRPEYLFDRDRLYFFAGSQHEGPGDCWDKKLWPAVGYVSPSITSASPAIEAPWFSDTSGTTLVTASPASVVSSNASGSSD